MNYSRQQEQNQSILDRLTFPAHRRRTVPHLLAEHLERQILALNLPSDSRVCREQDLVQRWGLSRSVVREALRLLESRGIVKVKVGAGGGVYTRPWDNKLLRDSLSILVSSQRMAPLHVLQARRELEVLCAKLAAINRSEDDIRSLRESLMRQKHSESDPIAFLQENIRFHLIVAECVGNPIITAIMHSVRDLLYDTSLGYMYSAEAMRSAQNAHRRLVDVIAASDDATAMRVMEGHMRAVEQYLQQTGQIMPEP